MKRKTLEAILKFINRPSLICFLGLTTIAFWEYWGKDMGMKEYLGREDIRVVDGDTIDVIIDLGFDLYKKERVRIAGIDTPEKRTRDLEEKELGIDATNWMKGTLEDTINGEDELTIRTELKGGMGKYGRLLGWLYVGESDVSLNEQMIAEGYAWAYDGGSKNKNFQELKDIRIAQGTYQGDIEYPDGTHEING